MTRIWSVAAVGLWAASLGVVALANPTGVAAARVAQGADTLPDAAGKEIVSRLCTVECHGADRILSTFVSKSEWDERLQQMLDRGAQIGDKDYEPVLDYLAAQFPLRFNINAASAKDLQAKMTLSAEESQAVVDYRTANGDFMSLADLKKVPGLPAAKVDAAKRQLRFGHP